MCLQQISNRKLFRSIGSAPPELELKNFKKYFMVVKDTISLKEKKLIF